MKRMQKAIDDDNVPLNIVRRNLYRKEVIKRANWQFAWESDCLPLSNRTNKVKVTSMQIEHSHEEWIRKREEYIRKSNRRFVMVGGCLVKGI